MTNTTQHTLYVDAGCMWFSDPERTLKPGSVQEFPTWSEFCDKSLIGFTFPSERPSDYMWNLMSEKVKKMCDMHIELNPISYSTYHNPEPFGPGAVTVSTGHGDGSYSLAVRRNNTGKVTEILVDFMGLGHLYFPEMRDLDEYDMDEELATREDAEEWATQEGRNITIEFGKVVGAVTVESGILHVGDPCYVYTDETRDKMYRLLHEADLTSGAAEPWEFGLGTVISEVPNGTFNVVADVFMEGERQMRHLNARIDFTSKV